MTSEPAQTLSCPATMRAGTRSSAAIARRTACSSIPSRTTGVYCRPSCAARLPRRENVAFHATCADAERAGFRPCKRCRPNEPARAERQAAAVATACRLIEEAEEAPSLDELAQAAGHEPLPFPPGVQGGHRRDARRPMPKPIAATACARSSLSARHRDPGYLWGGLQFEAAASTAASSGLARHDADGSFAPAAAAMSSALRSANVRSVRSWSRRRTRASARSSSAMIRTRLVRSSAGPVSAMRGWSAATGLRATGRQGGWLRRAPGARSRPARSTSAARHSSGGYGMPSRAIPAGSTASYAEIARRIGAPKAVRVGGAGLRFECDRGCHSVPPGGAHGRVDLRLSLGRCTQARFAGAGGAGMSGRTDRATRALRQLRARRSRSPPRSTRSTGRGLPATWTRMAAPRPERC